MIVRLCKVSSWTKNHVEGKDGTAMLRSLEIHLARVPAPDLEVVLKHSDGAHLRIVLTQIMWLPWCFVSLFWSCKVVCIMYLYIYLYISIYLYIYTYIYIHTMHILCSYNSSGFKKMGPNFIHHVEKLRQLFHGFLVCEGPLSPRGVEAMNLFHGCASPDKASMKLNT